MCANGSAAYVDGGMYFTQNDKRLYVPTCGYYYISSQVYYQSNSLSPSKSYVRHHLRVDRNCGDRVSDNLLSLRSYSSLLVSEVAPDSGLGRTSTHIADVVKMCKGGSIHVRIPYDSPCCPIGRFTTTYFSAFMVAETTCEFPIPLDHPPTN